MLQNTCWSKFSKATERWQKYINSLPEFCALLQASGLTQLKGNACNERIGLPNVQKIKYSNAGLNRIPNSPLLFKLYLYNVYTDLPVL